MIRLIYELLVLTVKIWKLSNKSFFLLDSPYAYSLLLCAGKVNFNNSLFLVSWHFRDYMAKGQVVFPGEVATLGVRPPTTKSLIKRMSWKVYMITLKVGLCFVVRPLFNLRCRLFPMEVYIQESLHLPHGFSGVEHTRIHHGSGARDKKIVFYHEFKYLWWVDGMDNIKGFLMAAGCPAFLKVPTTKINFTREISRRLPMFVKAFPDLRRYFDELGRYKNLGKTALLFTQPLNENRFCSSLAQQKRVYDFLVGALCKSGYAVLIKPHPWDTLNYSHLETDDRTLVLRGFFPGEVVAASLPDAVAVSVCSTIVEAIRRDNRGIVFLGRDWMIRHFKESSHYALPKFGGMKMSPIIKGDIDKRFLLVVAMEVVNGRPKHIGRCLEL